MTTKDGQTGGELFIVDNSDKDWKVRRYLHEWAEISNSFDIATGCFEIGSLLALDGQWQKLDKIRILMGSETTYRTRVALLEALKTAVKKDLDFSVEKEKDKNDFLTGVPAILDALRSRKIECRVYTAKKFHAKAYITHARLAVVGSAALVGSSNFTQPGLEDNVELNVQVRREVEVLQQWFEQHWTDAEEVTAELVDVIDRHVRAYSPFLIYAKALQEYFKGHEMTVGEWEQNSSKVYRVLDQYQKEGYQALMKIAGQFRGAFLCDGVGLGKTFIGLMLIDRLINRDRKKVALIVPRAARIPVWEKELRKRLPGVYGDFSNLVVFNHTDLNRSGNFPERLEKVRQMADVIIIDEAHHFRNPGIKGEGEKSPSRYWRLSEVCEGKDVFFLTATPVNNSLLDLQHMMELFTRREPDYFKAAPLGIHSLPGHFRKMEKALEAVVSDGTGDGVGVNQNEAEQVLQNDALFRALVVQRSRAYVKASQATYGGTQAIFPTRADPQVVDYSVKKTYGRLLTMIDEAFSKTKPLFSLAIYNPLAYYKGPGEVPAFEEGRQNQVVGLIRIQFLKRFESSAYAFERSCMNLLYKILAFVTKNSLTPAEIKRLERWKGQKKEILDYVQLSFAQVTGDEPAEDEELISEEDLAAIDALSRDEFAVDEILQESYFDLDQIVDFLVELRKFEPKHDDKLRALIKLLKADPVLKTQKVLIFSEFMATARYLQQQLEDAGITGVDEVDSASKRDRGDVISQFSPYYNESSSAGLAASALPETRVLISTDVLSEGLNLQDATRLINYDLHWNPVRLMQRIGRVDRRLNPEIEGRLLADHPEQRGIRETVAYWNFLPPDDLDLLLKLYRKVSHKTLRISKAFGIEGKKLLKPEDDFEALKDFNQSYEGTTTKLEEMHLEYQTLLQQYPGIEKQLNALPGKVFSGKAHPKEGSRAVFFCYALPAPPAEAKDKEKPTAEDWTEEAGQTRWYLYDLLRDKPAEDPAEILELIRCTPETPRRQVLERPNLAEMRAKLERYIKNTYLRQVQAPIGTKPILKAWMELS